MSKLQEIMDHLKASEYVRFVDRFITGGLYEEDIEEPMPQDRPEGILCGFSNELVRILVCPAIALPRTLDDLNTFLFEVKVCLHGESYPDTMEWTHELWKERDKSKWVRTNFKVVEREPYLSSSSLVPGTFFYSEKIGERAFSIKKSYRIIEPDLLNGRGIDGSHFCVHADFNEEVFREIYIGVYPSLASIERIKKSEGGDFPWYEPVRWPNVPLEW